MPTILRSATAPRHASGSARIALLAAASALLLMGVQPVRAGAPPAATSPPKHPANTTPVYLPHGSPVPDLPDSVAARIDATVDIPVRELADAVARLGRTTRPDTVPASRRREFLNVLVDKVVLSRRAIRESWTWTRAESSSYNALRDRLTLDAALDSAERRVNAARIARGDSALTGEALGIETRETNVLALDPQFDTALLARIAVSFDTLPRPKSTMTIQQQLEAAGAIPVVAASDLDRTLAHTRTGPYRVRDLIESWTRLNPIYRPRVSTADQVADLVRNGLFESQLRKVVRDQRLEERPDIASQLAKQREFLAVNHFVQREIYDRIPMDSVTLQKHFRRKLAYFDLPPRSNVLRLYLPDSAGAVAMAERLRRPGEAESLAARAGQAGTSFVTQVSPYGDSLVYVRAARAGVGGVLGPEWTPDGWLVHAVMTLEPARHRTFREARSFVEKDWIDVDGERRMKALLDRLRAAADVRVNERALGGDLPDPGRRKGSRTGPLWKTPGDGR